MKKVLFCFSNVPKITSTEIIPNFSLESFMRHPPDALRTP